MMTAYNNQPEKTREAEWYDEADAPIGLAFANLAVPALTTA